MHPTQYSQQLNSPYNSVETDGLNEKSTEYAGDSTARLVIESDSVSATSSNTPRISSGNITNNNNMMQARSRNNNTNPITYNMDKQLNESPSTQSFS